MTLYKNWMPIVVGLVAAALFSYLLFEEANLSESGIVRAISADLRTSLYQTAVSGLLTQSGYFSNWSIGLIVGGWIVLINDGKPGQGRLAVFIVVCVLALVSLYLGQMLHQVVITDIERSQDPLDNTLVGTLITYQYRVTAACAALIAGAVAWRHIDG